jgi:threonine aldolase
MPRINRRSFVKSAAALTLMNNFPLHSTMDIIEHKPIRPTIHFTSDGLNLTPLDYARLLLKLAEEEKIVADNYSLAGSIAELETKFAQLLGKESAIFLPTGTLANHLAIRTLAAGKNRVIVQQESHIYNDSGDCVQTLSHLNLIPLAFNRATFTLSEVMDVWEKNRSGRVATEIGVISIESPVRRKLGELFDYGEMKKIAEFARNNNIKLHLDGARIFLASAYSGITPATYAQLFDTVYISLYKYFNAASGAILAGPKALLENMFHTRRMFGAGLPEAWPYAAVALHYMEGFTKRFEKAVQTGEELMKNLAQHLRIERIPGGSNIFKLHAAGIDTEKYWNNLRNNGVLLRPAEKDRHTFTLTINETLNQISAAELSDIFIKSLPA